MKIFAIGLSRTGTRSLTEALKRLGYRIAHYPVDRKTFRELTAGQYRLSILDEFDGISDITSVPFFPQLDKHYPGSKFILTVRDRESWLRSMENHFRYNPLSYLVPDLLTERKMRRFLRAAVYGCYTFNRERMSYVYDLHHERVREYFKDDLHRLLVIDIVSGQGWETLCPFLDKPMPNEPFPKI